MTDLEKRLNWIEARADSGNEGSTERATALALVEIVRQLARIANRLEFAVKDQADREPAEGTLARYFWDEARKKEPEK